MDNSHPPEAWKLLGRAAEKRRGQLGYGFRQRPDFLRDRGGTNPPSVKMLNRLERGERQSYPDSTVARLEALYGWEPGSFEAVLRGGEPTPSPGTPGGPDAEPPRREREENDALAAIMADTRLPLEVRAAFVELAKAMRRRREEEEGGVTRPA